MGITRRRFLESFPPIVAGVAGAGVGVAGARVGDPQAALALVRVNGMRLREHLEQLSQYGRPAGGTFADGVTRIAYSQADIDGRGYMVRLLREAHLEPRIDPAGNIVARRSGARAGAPPILVGSHIDSVPGGGNFDGDLGSLGAIEVVQTLADHGLTTGHPIEIVVWANEEGVAYGNGLCGSRAAAGQLVNGELDEVWNGVRKADAIRAIGGDPDHMTEARRAPGSFHCYLELHIEQGGTLDREGLPVGIVQGIVGIDRYEAVVRGVANHAGTTPMNDRHDALVAASQLVLAVRDIVTREEGRQVGTVGQLSVTPNAPNVIPGLVRLTIELRDLSAARLAGLIDAVRRRAADIAAATGTTIDISPTSHDEAAMTNQGVQDAIERAVTAFGVQPRRLPSGAGHDAQMMAQLGPMGMVFVRSIGGVSHSPKELSSWEDCALGASVLLRAVLEVDRL